MREVLIFAAMTFVLVLGLVTALLTDSYYEVGIASWYGPGFHGKRTASGEIYDMYGISAAHKTLPFGTIVKVVDLETQRSVVVRINDRGPFIEGRIIDLSYGAALELGMVRKGLAKVGLKILEWPRKDNQPQ
ncbi:TPA: septal ring lytic transglycosylase RlpA family protein [Candidatus Bipolaricaulota bacterium]|nr:septal ring lytic transglycosylase RlpA family protein [Candidatus Bipolaricaulota bacterium]